MKPIIFVSFLWWVTACQGAEPDYVETDKIHLLFGDANKSIKGNWVLDEKEKIISFPELLRFSIQMDIKHITWVEFSDVSAEDHSCMTWDFPVYPLFRASPSTIVSFTLNPTAGIQKIDFRMPLPCAAFHQKFYYLIKVKSLEGNYFVRKKFPGIVRYNNSGVW
ncbi:MAG: hypothetical protein HY080_01905 [Gammaproteobacteria bacterium]|nr:hypothetical protein [Gammaproteobacteria bacterium]